MDTTFLHIWNGWSIMFLVLFALNMVATGVICSQKGKALLQVPMMIFSGLMITLIFAFSGILAALLSVPAGIILALTMSKLFIPDWNKGHYNPPLKFPAQGQAVDVTLAENDDQDSNAA